MLVSFFSLVGLTVMSLGAAVLADDHPFVDLVAGADEHFGPLLQAVEAEGHGLAADHRHQHAVGPAGDVAFHRAIALEAMVHDGRALRGVEQPRPQADQPAGRNREGHVRVLAAVVHLDHLAAARADQFHHRAQLVVRHFDHQRLERLFGDAVALVQDHLRLADRKLVAFAAHGFDQHAQVQQAAAGDGVGIAALDRLDPQGDVPLQLLASADRAGGGW